MRSININYSIREVVYNSKFKIGKLYFQEVFIYSNYVTLIKMREIFKRIKFKFTYSWL